MYHKIEHNLQNTIQHELYNIALMMLICLEEAHKQLTFLIALFISHCAHIQALFVIYNNFTSTAACFPMIGHNGPLEAPGSQMPLVTLARSIIVLAPSSAKGCVISALSESALRESFFNIL